jgi:hypothetical protein
VFAVKIKKEVRSIESEKGKERKMSQLLLKYGDLNLVKGFSLHTGNDFSQYL